MKSKFFLILNYYPFSLYGHFNENRYNIIAKFILKQIKN